MFAKFDVLVGPMVTTALYYLSSTLVLVAVVVISVAILIFGGLFIGSAILRAFRMLAIIKMNMDTKRSEIDAYDDDDEDLV